MDRRSSRSTSPTISSIQSLVVLSVVFLTHFNSIQKGVIDLRDIIFFTSLIAVWLYANMLAIESGKGH
jgi:hypothetical protein